MIQSAQSSLASVSRFLYYNLGLRELKWKLQDKFGDQYRTVSLGGIKCDFIISNVIEYHRFNTIVGESAVIEDILEELTPNDVFFDVGANVGLYTCLIGERLTSGKTVAFEPHPKNYERLVENLELNEQRAKSEKIGLSNSRRSAEMTVGRNIAGAGGPQVGNKDSVDETVAIELMSGDEYVSKNNIVPDVIKIDVEGHEYAVLDGLRKTLESESCRVVYCEIHPDKLEEYGHSTNKVKSLLSDFGYRIKKLPTDRFIVKAIID